MKISKINKNKPTSVGIGLLALDVVMNGDKSKLPQVFAGGSCGNVLSILSFLGWNSFPIARFSNSHATDEVLNDLQKWGVNDDLIFIEETGSTPIIIHRILKDKKGNIKHRFEFRVPETNTWFPNYKSIVREQVPHVVETRPDSDIFYLDRISRAALDLAQYYKKRGALIFFEPSSYKEDKQFLEAIGLADIIKFSTERISSFSEKYPEKQAFLEIETLGSEGLIYRTKKSKKNDWNFLASTKISKITDSAGAGDWCSAGIIHLIGRNGVKGLKSASISEIEEALKFGQVLAATNCHFEGARGLMYNLDIPTINKYLVQLESKESNLKLDHHQSSANKKPISFEHLMRQKR